MIQIDAELANCEYGTHISLHVHSRFSLAFPLHLPDDAKVEETTAASVVCMENAPLF